MCKKFLSFLLVLAIIMQLLPVGVFADTNADTTASVVNEEPYVLGEDPSLREEHVKHFRLSDGRSTAVSYALPVHYEKNGSWQQIDNTLIENGEGYINKANSLSVYLPKVYDSEHGVRAAHSDHEASFVLLGCEPAEGETEKYSWEYDSELERATAADTRSGMIYKNIMPGTDLRYVLESKAVFEYISVSSLDMMREVYEFELRSETLKPILMDDGGIGLYAGDEEILYMPPAYMRDSAGEICTDMKTELYEENGRYILRCIPSGEWLEASERKWPVAIDPTIYEYRNINNIRDAVVYSGCPNTNFQLAYNMLVGRDRDYGKGRIYIKWASLPALSSSDVISSAMISFKKYSISTDSVTVKAYAVNEAWASERITWNTQPQTESGIVLDYQEVTSSGSIFYWSITDTARRWYASDISELNPLENQGIALTAPEAETSQSECCGLISSDSGIQNRPVLYVFYMNADGIEEYWDYTSQSIGRAGTAYVQNFSGSLTLSRTDTAYGGSRMPAEISFYYNFSDRDSNIGYGYGWRSTYAQKLEPVTISAVTYYRWKDGDGTVKYFANTDGCWKDEAGQGYELTINTAAADSVKYKISDKGGNMLGFDSYGRLSRIKDKAGNMISISYTSDAADNLKISTVTDGAGRSYYFSYAGHLLSNVVYKGTGTTALETITYAYSSNCLSSVTYADGKNCCYTYSGHIMTGAQDILKATGDRDGLSFTYHLSQNDNTLPVRIREVAYTAERILVSSCAFVYGVNYTTVTDNAGRSVTYQFNNSGNTTAVYNDEGQALYGRYARDDSSSARANQLVQSSRLQDTVTGRDPDDASRVNLLQNTDLDAGMQHWSGSGSVITYSGARALCLDENALKLTGISTAAVSAVQTVSVSGTERDQYSFGAWVRSNSVPLTEDNRACGIKVSLYSSGELVNEEYVSVNADCREWQFISGSITAEGDYDSVRFSCVYDHNLNETYFDGMQLFKERFASKCEYDDDGNITKITDISGNETTYEYVSGSSDISRIDLPGGGHYSYTYNDSHAVTQTVSATNVQTDYSYDAYGNCTGTVISAARAARSIESSTTYTTDGNMTATVTGGDGNTVTYTNDTELSLTTAVTDPRGNSTLSTYDELRRLVSSSCGSAEVSYTYSDDLLTELRHSNTGTADTVYTFVYGPGGLTEEVKVGDTVLSANTYNPGTWTLSQQSFGNGQWWKYSYDRMDTLLERYTNITAASGIAFVYHYNSKGLLSRIDLCEVSFDDTQITSSTLVSSEKYYYDASDRLYKAEEVTPGDDSSELTVHSYECEFDAKENVTRLVETIEGTSYTYSFTYDNDGRPTAVIYGGITEEISYDALGRSTRQRMQENGSTVVDRRYTYKNIDDEKTTTLVSRVSNTFGSASLNFSYRYDANGNITRVDDGTSITSYTYNSRNELSWEKNAAAGKAWYYAHDYGGNITRRTEYDYIDGELSGTGTVVTYRYGDSGWKDKLTAYNGQTITYDAIGNPLSYRGMTMTWQGGRQLASVTNGGTALSFAYNEAGLRTSKNVNGSEHKYYWTNGKLSAEICDDYSLFFHYNANGDILGYSYSTNGTTTEYYYVKNLQGDILRVIDVSGTVAASYTYDAWGRLLSSSGSMAIINPIRYRGYYYDTETCLYYLQSRYYDPEVCRFINADAYASTGQGIHGCNMFAYCGNNPVNRTDDEGNLSIPNWAKIAIGVVAIGIGVIATVATGGAAVPALIAGVKTALVIGAISAGTSAATTALSSTLNGDDIKTTAKKLIVSAVDGFCDGFMAGGIMAGASMTYGSLLKNAEGIKIGTTEKPQYGRANIGYGTPKTNGNTIISIQNNAGKSVFRLDADAINMLHMHYGKTKATMAIHRTGIIRTIAGVISGVN